MANDTGTDQVSVSKADGVCTITFTRPEKKNAFTHAMYTRCTEALKDADADKSVRCVMFTSTGTAFTAGNDLFDFMNNPPAGFESPVLQFLYALHATEKPIVVAVQGVAVGIGVTMLLGCDLVYASAQATFKLPFVSLGLVPEGASSMLLPRMAGHAQAAEALLLGESFDAATAHQLGLVTRVVPAEELESFARAQAHKLVALPAASVRATKRLLRAQTQEAIKKVITDEAMVFAERLGSPEAGEAFAAFFEKRKPDFSKLD
jgi:enoyl-CoA hydratase/carnithine racemase